MRLIGGSEAPDGRQPVKFIAALLLNGSCSECPRSVRFGSSPDHNGFAPPLSGAGSAIS